MDSEVYIPDLPMELSYCLPHKHLILGIYAWGSLYQSKLILRGKYLYTSPIYTTEREAVRASVIHADRW